MADLELPPQLGGQDGDAFFAVWRSDGSLLKSGGLPAGFELPPPQATV